jgi:hypothetical protein
MKRATALALLAMIACGGRRDAPLPELGILGESTRWRSGDPVPATGPWFDGVRVALPAARGETLGLLVFRARGEPARLAVGGARVAAFAVERAVAARRSTSMYGPSRGTGAYIDGLVPVAGGETVASDPAYFELAIPRDAPVGELRGELVVGTRSIPVAITVAPVTLPPPRLDVWAYFDQRELAWARSDEGVAHGPPRAGAPTGGERACIALFRAHGVMLSPDFTVDAYAARRDLLEGFPYIPAVLPDDPTAIGPAVRAWLAATAGTGQVPFAIPVDEPADAAARAKVRAIGDAVHAAGGGPGRFLVAVTDAPRPDYGAAVDLYISWGAAHLDDPPAMLRWTYNGKPPRAGAMTLDTPTPGTRTWGWIAHRYRIPVWYAWDALYWHDRHNRRGAPLPGRALAVAHDAASFANGDDSGNLDGVLALPALGGSCRPTLRLAALRRGFQDRALLELAARCDPTATAALVAELVPRALGDAPDDGDPPWPDDDAAWEAARRRALAIAARCPQ